TSVARHLHFSIRRRREARCAQRSGAKRPQARRAREGMYTLGINAAYHDTSARLVEDGNVIAAAEEERFTRIKHGKRPVPFSAWELPYHAIDRCLEHAGNEPADVDHIGYAYDPYLLLETTGATITLPLEPSRGAPLGQAPWEPLFLSYVLNAERQLVDGVPHRLRALPRREVAPALALALRRASPEPRSERVPRVALRRVRGDDPRRARRARVDELRTLR